MTDTPTPTTKLWLLERGEYSDRRVVGIFATKEKADLFALCCHREKEPWETDEEYQDRVCTPPSDIHAPREVVIDQWFSEIQQGLTSFYVSMQFDGNNAHAHKQPADEHEDQFNDYTELPIRTISMHVWAKDATHAIKIANERRAVWRAEQGI